jgi:uncharacterized protein (DUF2164 family)
MTNKVKDYLNSITPQDLEDFQHDVFVEMVSSQVKGKSIKLGVNAKLKFIVKENDKKYVFESSIGAIERYKECILNK